MFRSLNHFTFFLYNITFLFFIFWFLILLFFFHRENNRPIFRKFFKSSILRAYIYIPAVSYPHLSSNKTAYKSIKCVIYPLPHNAAFHYTHHHLLYFLEVENILTNLRLFLYIMLLPIYIVLQVILYPWCVCTIADFCT